MSNIHSLADYRRDGSAPARGGAAASSPTPLMSGGRSNFGTIQGLRSTDAGMGGAPSAGGYNEPAREGISFFRSPDTQPGTSPTIGQQCCPRIGWRYLTTAIALVNLIIFIAELIVGATKYGCAFASDNQMGGPNGACLYCMGAKSTGDIHSGAVWRLITPIFLHAGILHILGNTWMLLRFGYILETRFGWWRFGLVYLLAGIGASMWSAVLGYDTISVGASGAIMGIMGADITYVMYNYHEIPDVKIEAIFIVVVVVMNFLFGISDTGIDNYAHLGGLVMGLPLGLWFVPLIEKRSIERVVRIVAGVVYLGLFLLFALLLWAGTPGNQGSYPDGFCSYPSDYYKPLC